MRVSSNDPYAHNKKWFNLRKEDITPSKGPAYTQLTYITHPDFKHGLPWKLGRFVFALLASLSLLPLILKFAWVKVQWKAAFSGVDQKVVRIAKQLVPNPADSPSSFKETVLSLQPYMQNTNSKHPTIDLSTMDPRAFPKYKLTIDSTAYYISDPFEVSKNNIGVFALVQMGDKVYPRIFYRSNSQATWRVIPDADKGSHGFRFIGKGQAEVDTQLPIELMLKLQSLPPATPDTIPGIGDVVKTRSFFESLSTFSNHVGLDQISVFSPDAPRYFIKGSSLMNRTPQPSQIPLPTDPAHLPDFKARMTLQKFQDPQYGNLTASVYPSMDRTIQYLFYEKKNGKVFLAAAEKVTNNPITPYGVRQAALDLHGADAPLLEYHDQIPKEYEPSVSTEDTERYKSNWNYVREIPLIQAFYASKKKTVPPTL